MEKTQVAVWNREIVTNKALISVLGVTSFVTLVALGAWVRIPLPFTPVPITLQTFFVLLSGAFLGRRLGSISQLIYVGLGAFGVSIFATQIGLTGPTGGYLIGFIIAPFVIGKLLENRKTFLKILVAMSIGSSIILFLGMIQLSIFLHCGLKSAFLMGVFPFIAGDILKTFLATIAYDKFHGYAKR